MPKIGGFSLASVPRPRAPLRRLRRPFRRFFYCRGVSFVTRNDVNLITLGSVFEKRHWFAFDDTFPELKGHRLHIIFVQA